MQPHTQEILADEETGTPALQQQEAPFRKGNPHRVLEPGPYGAYSARGMYYEIAGTGQPLFLIHGFGMSGHVLADKFNLLKRHYRVIVPDLRGHGRSQHLAAPHSIEELADDLLALADELALGRFNVMGYSMGGMVSQALALKAPERVERLVLGGTTACKRKTWFEKFSALVGFVVIWLVGPRVMSWFNHPVFTGGQNVDRSHLRYLRKVLQNQRRRQLSRTVRAIFRWDSREKISALHTPTLIFHGEKDTLMRVFHAHDLKNRLPNAQLITFPEAGHPLIHTHSQEITQLAREFLQTPRRN